MSVLRIEKVVGALPGVLTANTLYFVRAGLGFGLALTDSSGSVARTINLPAEATGATSGLMSAQDKTKLDATPKITTSALAPSSPAEGDIWIDIS